MNKKTIILSVLLSAMIGGLAGVGGFIFMNQGNQQSSQLDKPIASHATKNVSLTSLPQNGGALVPEDLNFVKAASKTLTGVVHIKTYFGTKGGNSRANQQRNPLEEMFPGFRFFYPDQPRQQKRGEASGSGVILSEDGYIATNNHVVEDGDEIEVVLNDKRTFKAKVIGTDPGTDLALLKIDADGLDFIPFGNSEQIQVGEWVLAVGNPFNLTSTVTAGIVSAKGRNINILSGQYTIESFIQTDAAVNPGNSGGALVNLRGELVGINTAIASPTGSYSGYAFAIPSSIIHKVISDLKEYGVVQRAVLGVQIQNLNSELAKEHDIKSLNGVYVADVVEGGAAEEAGLQGGDVITAINGVSVNNVAELQEQIGTNKPGDKVVVDYTRDNKKRSTEVTLKNIIGETKVVKYSSTFELKGATFANISSSTAEKLGIDGGIEVVKIGNGPWKQAGIQKGFIITSVDREPVKDIKEFVQTLKYVRGGGVLIEGIYEDGTRAYYGIGLR
ncbi:Do family serine endopeptidase [Aureibacter tunicatorum]|uniref:Do/DeqQ family serine protease n=1 Tax=Aureibacter tunicatorum TaxID=866807 RepID=A0AAE4BRS8_9BACT|nr:Do family serine endopeptidase [Aureibacter tunicatorum]MDR6238165.1 Do/DeqQ family serine protease [Aureibacter tunicatorum]BDD03198.1 serine protease [Aureibacter tunicatorum]